MSEIFINHITRWLFSSPPAEWAINQLRELLIGALKQGPVPQHVAFEMDGNRRYARGRKMETIEGHHHGFEALARVRGPMDLSFVALADVRHNRFSRFVTSAASKS